MSLLALVMLTVGCFGGGNQDSKLHGKWTGQGGVTIEFQPGNKIRMSTPGEIDREGLYWTNFKKKPYWIDIDLQNMDKNIQTVFGFDSEGRLQIETTQPGQPRPKALTPSAVFFTKTGQSK
ncbi:MAG: hypothetical protein AB1758_30305 [Candidatus Eremiobacterota bacterium]